jgi:adenosine/AMP kinase
MDAAKRRRVDEEEEPVAEEEPSKGLTTLSTTIETAHELEEILKTATPETVRFVNALLVRGADVAIRYDPDDDTLWEEDNPIAALTFLNNTVAEKVVMISMLTDLKPMNRE